MGTIVTIQVVRRRSKAVQAATDRAFGWFYEIEERCTRFDPQSELMQLCAQTGVPVVVSTMLFEALQFALMMAQESGGAFDPTVGRRMEANGFSREHRTGQIICTPVSPEADVSYLPDVSYLDIQLDPERRTVTLRRPLVLDLGAVAKGLAIDMAVRELAPFRDFAIDAGGDLYMGGSNPRGEPWQVGIAHPRRPGQLMDELRISNKAVCTSGHYERGPHIEDQRTGAVPNAPLVSAALPAVALLSATVVADGAMLADALATAAFVLGANEGLRLVRRMGAEGLMVATNLVRYETHGLRHAA